MNVRPAMTDPAEHAPRTVIEVSRENSPAGVSA